MAFSMFDQRVLFEKLIRGTFYFHNLLELLLGQTIIALLKLRKIPGKTCFIPNEKIRLSGIVLPHPFGLLADCPFCS